MNKTELYILKGLISFGDYAAKFNEKVQPDAFSPEIGPIINAIKKFYFKYQKSPSISILIDKALPKIFKGDEELLDEAEGVLQEAMAMKFDKEDYYDWLVDETVSFIKRNAVEDAFMEAYNMMEGDRDNIENLDKAIDIIIQANAISFDDDLGLDYFEDVVERGERMAEGVDVMKTGISDELDREIGGGWHKKSLNIFGAGTNVGKTLILSDVTLNLVAQGYNGLYITLEIYEDLLANRIDANLIDVNLSEIPDDPKLMVNTVKQMKKDAEDRGEPFGRLIIKESSPGCLSANAIMALVRDLALKRNGFQPDFLVIDYIGLMTPNASGFSDNTYGKLKTVAEELRTVGSKLNVPVFSAVQVNRDGMNSSEPGLENTADSMGIPMTADLMIMVTRPEIATGEDKMCWYFAKSRFSKNGGKIFLGVDYNHMRLMSDTNDSLSVHEKLRGRARQAKKKVNGSLGESKDGIIKTKISKKQSTEDRLPNADSDKKDERSKKIIKVF